MIEKRQSRFWIFSLAGIALAMSLAYAFWPRAILVDIGSVQRGAMQLSIDEEAKTRVRDTYVVSAPITGRILRVDVEAGDEVIGGKTVVVNMLPVNSTILDTRSRETARSVISRAKASLRMAKAELNRAMTNKELADKELARSRKLHKEGTLSLAGLERIEQNWNSANAALASAKAAVSLNEADVATAQAQLISFSESPTPGAPQTKGEARVEILAPVSGKVLRVMQRSETTLSAGSPILEIGDTSKDLEIIAELLSRDAVKVEPGMPVIVEKWGGATALHGVVVRVEPWGFTKFSALGVEEQRVNVIIRFNDPISQRINLGHGFRVELRIVVWQADDAIWLPASAMFRTQHNWAVFTVENGRARQKLLSVGHNNGLQAEVLDGLDVGEHVILYPGPSVQNGSRVTRRQLE